MGEKIRFYPLDASYKVLDGKAVIHLFGKTADGKQVCVLDGSFSPYFYVVPKKGQEIKEKLSNLKIEKEGETYFVTKAESVKRIYLGKEVGAIKAFVNLPRDVPVLREIIKEWDAVDSIYEYDILFARRYLIDKAITPMLLYEVEGSFVPSHLRIPCFKAEKLEQLGDETITKPRILAIDIETYTPANRAIDEAKNPILMIALYSESFQRVVTWKKFKTQLDYVEFVDSEAAMIEDIKKHIDSYRPDIITGYFSDGFDFPYIKTRADKYKIKLDLGADGSELRISRGNNVTAEITGVTHLDIFKFIRKVMGPSMDTGSFSLDAVASELLGEKKKEVNLDELSTA